MGGQTVNVLHQSTQVEEIEQGLLAAVGERGKQAEVTEQSDHRGQVGPRQSPQIGGTQRQVATGGSPVEAGAGHDVLPGLQQAMPRQRHGGQVVAAGLRRDHAPKRHLQVGHRGVAPGETIRPEAEARAGFTAAGQVVGHREGAPHPANPVDYPHTPDGGSSSLIGAMVKAGASVPRSANASSRMCNTRSDRLRWLATVNSHAR